MPASITTTNRENNETLVFDASTEDWNDSAVFSEHPVEDGSQVVDHIQSVPRVVRIDGTISASPLAFTGEEDGGPDRLSNAQVFLENLQPRYSGLPTVVELVSDRYGVLTSMMCVSMSYKVTSVVALQVTMELRQVLFATAEVGLIPPQVPQVAIAADVADEQQAGSHSAIEATANQSVAHSFFGRKPERSGRVELQQIPGN